MRIPLRSIHTVRARRSRTGHSESGFAVLVVIVLLAIVASLAIGNNTALGHLHRELRLLDLRQQKRYESDGTTRAPAARSASFTPPRPGSFPAASDRSITESPGAAEPQPK